MSGLVYVSYKSIDENKKNIKLLSSLDRIVVYIVDLKWSLHKSSHWHPLVIYNTVDMKLPHGIFGLGQNLKQLVVRQKEESREV